MSHTANIVEIFSSLQGEGLYTGSSTTFVRFEGCDLGCKWCDTPEALIHHDACQVESPPKSMSFTEVLNPVSSTKLTEIIDNFDDEFLSLTGGEPLLHSSFLTHWLSAEIPKRRVILETSGVHCNALLEVIPYIHVVSMDLKLPSSTGIKPVWNEHVSFLKIALQQKKEVYVKIVVTARTTDRDLQEAIRIISRTNRSLPVMLQPASPTLTFHETLTGDQLDSLFRLFSAYLPNVSVTPQMHKQWGVL